MNMPRMPYEYACVDMETRECTNAVYAPAPMTDSTYFEYVRVYNDPQQYLGKFYIEGHWYEREYHYDDQGNVTGYTDTLWTPAV